MLNVRHLIPALVAVTVAISDGAGEIIAAIIGGAMLIINGIITYWLTNRPKEPRETPPREAGPIRVGSDGDTGDTRPSDSPDIGPV
jgi:hypothetical protein